MAELATATGVLQVAGVGAQLCKTLWKCSNDIKNANRDINDIATEVKNTYQALESPGHILQQTELERRATTICTAALTDEASSALQECLQDCRKAFSELDKALKLAQKPITCVGVSLAARWRWPLKKDSTQSLQTRLGGLTTVVVLMVHILEFARKRASE